MKNVRNPLTIVGVFAGLAEISGTVVLPLIEKSLQPLFIWYIMLFPIVLVISFFITWNFNPYVLYPPGDFTNQSDFINLITKRSNKTVNEIKDTVLESVRSMQEQSKQISVGGSISLEELNKIISEKIDVLEAQIVEKGSEIVIDEDLSKRILSVIGTQYRPISGIAHFVGASISSVMNTINYLEKRKQVESITTTDGMTLYRKAKQQEVS